MACGRNIPAIGSVAPKPIAPRPAAGATDVMRARIVAQAAPTYGHVEYI
jgi:hypothetical protein